ncbi:transposase, partial [Candidatus Omnitrophota bacterium]
VGAGFPRPYAEPSGRSNNIKGRGNRAPTLGQIVAYFKYGTTKQINKHSNMAGQKFWQRNYFERVIRNEKELRNIREYIINNPIMWKWDKNKKQSLWI